MLSRAFRNRFIELHYDDIPSGELVNILQEKCQLPSSYAKKMVAIMKDLQVCSASVFITLHCCVCHMRMNIYDLALRRGEHPLECLLASMGSSHCEICSAGQSDIDALPLESSSGIGNNS